MERLARLLPRWADDIHKGDRGGVLIVGGCSLYRGAPLLAARSALRAGAGLAVVFSDECVCAGIAPFLPEAIVQTGLYGISQEQFVEVLELWEPRIGCLVLGPGIGRAPEAGKIVRTVWNTWRKPLLVDGDALYWLAEGGSSFAARRDALLTPHEGEAARLLETTPGSVRRAREVSVRALASRWGVVLLKGRTTLVDDGERTDVIGEGNRALAIPGSGDVLAGCAAAFAAAGVPLYESALLAAFVHGRTGRVLSHRMGMDGILASEVADAIPPVLHEMRMGFYEAETD